MKRTPLKRKTPLKTKKPSIKRVKLDPLDILFSEFIRLRAGGICQVCLRLREFKRLQCCHFHGRAMKSVRWDEDNAIAADAHCHNELDSQPLMKIEFFKSFLGEDRYNMLNSRMRNTHPKPDKKALALYYTHKIKELKNGESRVYSQE